MISHENIHRFYGKIQELRQNAEGWVLPTLYPDEAILPAYRENHYPTKLTKKLRHSKQFGIPKDFDTRNPAHLEELFCELFAGALLANPLLVESYVTSGLSVSGMARILKIPTDNMKIRLITYFLMRFPEETEEGENASIYLKAIEKKAWDTQLSACQKTAEEWIEWHRATDTQVKKNVRDFMERAEQQEPWEQLKFPE